MRKLLPITIGVYLAAKLSTKAGLAIGRKLRKVKENREYKKEVESVIKEAELIMGVRV